MGFAQSSGSFSLCAACVQKWVSQHTTICLGNGVKIAVKLEVTQLIIVRSACGELGVTANLIFVARVRFLSVTIKSMAKY